MEADPMQALSKLLAQTVTHLRALPPTARMLIAALMVILIMTLVLVATYTGRPSMVELPTDHLTPEARTQVLRYLQASGVPFDDSGGPILVPVERKYAILGALTDHQVIAPEQIDFDTLARQDSPFLSRAQQNKNWLIAKMSVLERTIGQMSGIRSATVVLDQPDGPPGLGRAHVPPTATVSVQTSGSTELSQQQVDAMAAAVAKAHAGLKAQDVAVIDLTAGRRHQARSVDAQTASMHMDVKISAERHVKETLEDLLSYIPGVKVAVNAMVDTRQEDRRIDRIDEGRVLPLEERSRSVTSVNNATGGEAGVSANVGAAINAGARRGSQMTDEQSESRLLPQFPRDVKQVRDPKGYALKINTTIGVPRSYFVGKFRQDKNDPEAAPDEAALQTVIQAELARIKADVEPMIDTAAFDGAVPGTVVVTAIPDFAVQLAAGSGTGVVRTVPGGGAGGSGGAGGGGGLLDDGLVKYIGLGSLALISMAMMLLMVRRASRREELPTAAELVGIPPALEGADSDLVGEADESAPPLEGIELDDDSLRRQQMLDQINDLVKESPDEAASLVRKWMRDAT
jgi:flagellar M-ring protein FliF